MKTSHLKCLLASEVHEGITMHGQWAQRTAWLWIHGWIMHLPTVTCMPPMPLRFLKDLCGVRHIHGHGQIPPLLKHRETFTVRAVIQLALEPIAHELLEISWPTDTADDLWNVVPDGESHIDGRLNPAPHGVFLNPQPELLPARHQLPGLLQPCVQDVCKNVLRNVFEPSPR